MSQNEAKRAVDAGYWPLYRYNPANAEAPFKWETKEATASFQDFIRSERRYASLTKTNPPMPKNSSPRRKRTASAVWTSSRSWAK